MEQRYKKLSKYARDNGINYRTAWNYFNKGLINGAFKNEMGTILVPVIEKTSDNLIDNIKTLLANNQIVKSTEQIKTFIECI